MSLTRSIAKRLLPTSVASRVKQAARAAHRLDRLEAAVGQLVRERYAAVAAPRADALIDHELSIFSQNGEDGILLHLFATLGVTDRRFVEIGIGDGRENNTANLTVHFGWTGLMIDGDPQGTASARQFFERHPNVGGDRVRVTQSFVTRENVNDLIRAAGIEGDIDLFSLDIDGVDFHVWQALDVIRPRVVVVEYNASFGPERSVTVEYDPTFDRLNKHPSGWYHSASLTAFERLGRRTGYALIGTDSRGINAFFVRRELLGDKIRERTAADCYRPHAGRLPHATPAEQLARIAGLPLIDVEA